MEKYKYTIVGDMDHLIDEKGNTFIALRKMYWGDKTPEQAKLELRSYHTNAEGEETPYKGVTFLTEDGPSNLAQTLVAVGYGNTEKLLTSLSTRENFRPSLNNVLGETDELYDKSVPKDLYVPDDDLFEYDE